MSLANEAIVSEYNQIIATFSDTRMAEVVGLSVKLWSSLGSCCLVFDSATDSVVDILLGVLEHHDGVGRPPHRLIQVLSTQ